jgi:CO dehydrogenase nickel-insertion accessory protein CooC1
MVQDTNVPGIVFVLNKMRDELTEQFLRDKLAENGIEPTAVIHDALAVSMAGLMGEPLIKTPAQLEADWLVQALVTAVTQSPIPPHLAHLAKQNNHPKHLVNQQSITYMNPA